MTVSATVWQQHTGAHLDVARETFETLEQPFRLWLNEARRCIEGSGKIMFCGNGGSAADAQHLAAELSVKYCRDRKPIPALCLSLDPSAMTACGNDYGYERIFARQVEALARPGDMLVGISTSGNSANVLAALAEARARGVYCVGLTGRGGGRMADLCDLMIEIPSNVTAHIQEMHITIGHMLCAALERDLGLLA